MNVIELTPSRNYPDVGTLGSDTNSLATNVQNISDCLDIYQRNTRNLPDSFLRIGDFVDMGWATLNGKRLIPKDFTFTLSSFGSGQTLIEAAGVLYTLTAGSGISFAVGAGGITISATGGGGTVTSVNITAPAAGITASGGPITSSGSITLALANDLAALEGLSSTGIAVRTATDTWAQRTIAGTTNRVTATNGDGVAGNPTIDIAATYIGQASITTLGTIIAGTWHGTAIDLASFVTGILPAASFPALTGDVTTVAGALATTIAASAVTNAKMANMADQTFKANNSGGSAAPQDVTVSAVRTMLSINNVENTALSTWPGTTNITTLGTIATGVWHGTAIDLAAHSTGILPAASFPALTGDVTTSAGALATTIAAGAVTYAKIQNVTSKRVLGRATAGSGVVEELTANNGLTIQSGGIDDSVTIQTMWRLASVIWGGTPSDVYGGVLGLDGGSPSTVFTGLQTLDCSANRASA